MDTIAADSTSSSRMPSSLNAHISKVAARRNKVETELTGLHKFHIPDASTGIQIDLLFAGHHSVTVYTVGIGFPMVVMM